MASIWNSDEWTRSAGQISEMAFWSSRVNSLRVLDRARRLILDFLKRSKDTRINAEGEVVQTLRVGSRDAFVSEMQRFLIEEGFGSPVPEKKQSLVQQMRDIRSNRRLETLFKTVTDQAHGLGALKMSMDEEIRELFPAWEFRREGHVNDPRPLHEKNRGAIRRKDDTRFWNRMNSPKIGGFGKPYGPWGFGSQMGTREVPRAEAVRRGVISGDETPKAQTEIDFTAGLDASTRGMDPEWVARFAKSMGGRARVENGRIVYQPKETE